MRIEIEIPKEFEKHFNQDKFKDSLERIMADIEHSLENGDCLCAGRYEYETVEMLEKAFENSRQAYNIDKIIEELEKLADESYKAYCIAFNSDDRAEYDAYTNAIEIVKQGGVSDDVCEWKLDSHLENDTPAEWLICPHSPKKIFLTDIKYCPFCCKKIKVVE